MILYISYQSVVRYNVSYRIRSEAKLVLKYIFNVFLCPWFSGKDPDILKILGSKPVTDSVTPKHYSLMKKYLTRLLIHTLEALDLAMVAPSNNIPRQ